MTKCYHKEKQKTIKKGFELALRDFKKYAAKSQNNSNKLKRKNNE